jgi:hypothetical protein
MWESQIVREWKAEGRLEGERDSLLRLLRGRFPPEVPADLAQSIAQTTDLEELRRWFDVAMTTPSLDAFRTATTPRAPADELTMPRVVAGLLTEPSAPTEGLRYVRQSGGSLETYGRRECHGRETVRHAPARFFPHIRPARGHIQVTSGSSLVQVL